MLRNLCADKYCKNQHRQHNYCNGLTDNKQINSKDYTHNNFYQQFHEMDDALGKHIRIFLQTSLQHGYVVVEMEGVRLGHIRFQQFDRDSFLQSVAEFIDCVLLPHQIHILDHVNDDNQSGDCSQVLRCVFKVK